MPFDPVHLRQGASAARSRTLRIVTLLALLCRAAAGGRLPDAVRTSSHYAELDRSFEAGGRSAGDGYTANQVLGEWAGAQAYAAGGAGFTLGFVGDLAPIPAVVVFPGTPGEYYAPGSQLTLAASSSSLLPTLFAVISGPGVLAGDVLEFTGPGLVIVAAESPGGVDYQASAVVTNTYAVTPTPILRIVSGGSPAGGGAHLSVAAAQGAGLTIQQSPDLRSWATIGTVTASGFATGVPFTAPATGAGPVFYRALLGIAPSLRIRMTPAGGIELEVEADTGVTVEIQTGGDLKAWATLAQVGGRGAGIPVVVPVATGAGSPAAFFRLAVQ